jgi:hypothetical protein
VSDFGRLRSYAPAALYPPGRFLVLISVRGWVDLRAIMRLEGWKIDLIGTRTRDLPACSIVPQPTTLPRAPKSSKHTLNLHRLTSCTLLQLRTSRGYLLPRTDSSLNRMNSVTYIAKEVTRITGNTWTSPRTRKTQPPLLLRVGPCLQSCCLATRWSNPL